MLALLKIAQKLGIKVIFIQAKDCNENMVEIYGSDLIIRKISSVLHFTASDGFKSSFDVLSTAECDSLQCLFDFIDKKFKPDVGMWIEARLKMLARFVNGEKVVIPLCLANYDELAKRLLLGILYVLRNRIGVPIILDDVLSFIINELYSEAFAAMMRPYMFTANKNLDSREMLMYNPIIIAPGGQGGHYRIADPYRYVILFDNNRWAIPRKDIEKIARS